MMKGRKQKCPNCGNTNPRFFQDNGSPFDEDYTMLCVARVKPEDWAFDHVRPEADQLDENGLVACGATWEPNQE